MSKPIVLICDDVEDRRDQWVRALGEMPELDGWEVETLNRDFDKELTILKERQIQARGDGAQAQPATSRFDDASVLVVDYDLLRFEGNRWLTGEIVAYLARCYSDCGVIVGVNATGHSDPFDLTLVGNLDSFADVNIGDRQVANEALWGGPVRGFAPWAWPNVPRAVELLRQRSDLMAADPDSSMLDLLSMRDLPLPRQIRQHIEARGDSDPTVRAFVCSSDLGLRGDDAPDMRYFGKVAAARASHWLTRNVLPAQDIVSDAPHLIQRNPLLLAGSEDGERSCSTDKEHGSRALISDVERYRLDTPWFDRPVWRWNALNGDSDLPGVQDPWERGETEAVVFCEDVSAFVPSEHARLFVMDDIPTSMPNRWIVDPTSAWTRERFGDLSTIQYVPRVRLTA